MNNLKWRLIKCENCWLKFREIGKNKVREREITKRSFLRRIDDTQVLASAQPLTECMIRVRREIMTMIGVNLSNGKILKFRCRATGGRFGFVGHGLKTFFPAESPTFEPVAIRSRAFHLWHLRSPTYGKGMLRPSLADEKGRGSNFNFLLCLSQIIGCWKYNLFFNFLIK